MNKRFIREIRALYQQQSQKPLLQNDYIIHYDETAINKVYALIKGPHDSVYRHKFIQLEMTIPDNYPHSPPSVAFVNLDGVRIHPNMYEDGKCCATILNTWGDSKFEKWTSSMGIETVLLTFHSFLDNNPYTYEPGGMDDPSYSVYVLYQSWTSCLIRYLQYQHVEEFTQFIHNYLLANVDEIFDDLAQLKMEYPYGYYFTRCFEVDDYVINYERVISTLQYQYNYISYTDAISRSADTDTEMPLTTFENFSNIDFQCSICFDTDEAQKTRQKYIKLECGHKFHKDCMYDYTRFNDKLCPMCRRELTETEVNEFTPPPEMPTQPQTTNENVWVINPLTGRRVKVGSRTWQYLNNRALV